MPTTNCRNRNQFLRLLSSAGIAAALLAGWASAEEHQNLFQRTHEALEQFDAAEEEVDRMIYDWLASQEEEAQSTGNLNAVLAVRKSRTAYQQSRVIPLGAPTKGQRKRDLGRKRLLREADDVIREMTRLGKIDAAVEFRTAVNDALSGARRVTWIKVIDEGKTMPDVSPGPFYQKGKSLTADSDKDKLLFYLKQLKNFRARVTYRMTKECEAALIFRCPNARKSREVGYSIGLTSDRGWIYNVNKAFRFVHMSTQTKKIVDHKDTLSRASTTAGRWHTVEVIADGDHFVALLDGQILYEFRDSTHAEGAIGIQSRHGTIEIKTLEYADLP